MTATVNIETYTKVYTPSEQNEDDQKRKRMCNNSYLFKSALCIKYRKIYIFHITEYIMFPLCIVTKEVKCNGGGGRGQSSASEYVGVVSHQVMSDGAHLCMISWSLFMCRDLLQLASNAKCRDLAV